MRRWYVVYSKPHKEAFAEFQLRLKGLEIFLPRLLLPGLPELQKQIIPLFPSYLFARINLEEEYHYVLWTPGVKRVVSFNDVPMPLEEGVVEFLKKHANDYGLIEAHSNLRPGQSVQITGGPFGGLEAIIQEPVNSKGRVKVLLSLLSRQVKAEVPVQLVESRWVA